MKTLGKKRGWGVGEGGQRRGKNIVKIIVKIIQIFFTSRCIISLRGRWNPSNREGEKGDKKNGERGGGEKANRTSMSQ